MREKVFIVAVIECEKPTFKDGVGWLVTDAMPPTCSQLTAIYEQRGAYKTWEEANDAITPAAPPVGRPCKRCRCYTTTEYCSRKCANG